MTALRGGKRERCVDLEEIPPELAALIERGEDSGQLTTTDVDGVARGLELSGEQIAEIYDALDERGIEIDREDDGSPSPPCATRSTDATRRPPTPCRCSSTRPAATGC